ncbi:hypothetical protein BOX15_Mlig001715g4, partial [Macrostomum lignano]|uniref:Riboflavin transporter n=2 Tax=Macrostomum lignano TaxID=282301 RepID=A0A1I8J7F4_9PLAT
EPKAPASRQSMSLPSMSERPEAPPSPRPAPPRLSMLACFLIGSFALGSWIDINGVFNQLPLMVKSLPEGWSLPSYLAVIVQLGNIGPAAFLLASRLSRGKFTDRAGVFVINATGAVALLVLAFVWPITIDGRSLPLMLVVLTLSLVDCSSSVVYLSYMSAYPTAYLSALYVGEGVGGLIPGLLALIQGSGGAPECINGTHPEYAPPRYSVGAFYGLLCGMLCYSLLAFWLLTAWPFKLANRPPLKTEQQLAASGAQVSPQPDASHRNTPDETTSLRQPRRSGSAPNRAFLLCLVALLNAWGTGLLPSLQSYSALPYGYSAYHLAVTLANLANPLACFATFAWRARTARSLLALVAAGCLASGYVTTLAAMSPTPPLLHGGLGAALMIIGWTAASGLFSFAKACIAASVSEGGSSGEGRRWLRLTGVATQAGAAVGAVVGFLLSVVFGVLKDAPPC